MADEPPQAGVMFADLLGDVRDRLAFGQLHDHRLEQEREPTPVGSFLLGSDPAGLAGIATLAAGLACSGLSSLIAGIHLMVKDIIFIVNY